VCEFTRTLGKVLPVLLVQAGDLMFGTEDSLIAAVVQSIQGFLDPSARVIEEAALSKHLAGSAPLTLVLDGLDEAHNSVAVRRAINFWLRSTLSQSSILITTSRREFWRSCVDPSWVRWMPNRTSDNRSPIKVTEHFQFEQRDPIDGIHVPGQFSENELDAAWLRAGQPLQELFALADETKEELRHPFTLRVFLDLLTKKILPPPPITRAALLERWLIHRLDAEAVPIERITRSQFEQALQIVANRIAEENAGSVSVDKLEGVPRYDPTHPPGPVLQRLIEANILESVPGQSDHIRFSVETVQDFYKAEADIDAIKNDPKGMAESFSRISFTRAYPRLVRIGYRLVDEKVRNEFAQRLAELDVRMAAIVLRAKPGCFSKHIRLRIASELGMQIMARHRVRAAMAINLLGELNCQESIETLAECLLPPADPHPHLKSHGATTFTTRSYASAAQFVYLWERFGISPSNDTYYFEDLLATIRGATPEFRSALADRAMPQLSSDTGTKEHVKAVTVLAYLGDSRLVDNLNIRLTENGLLHHYENHALIALGNDAAGASFEKSVLAVGERIARLTNDQVNHEARNELISTVIFPVYDVRYLLTPAFEPYLQRLIEDESPDVSWIATDLVRRGFVASLLYPAAVAAANRKGWSEMDRGAQRICVNADMWMEWWRKPADTSIRRKLLGLLPLYPHVEIEEILMDCLDSPDLRASAARILGEYGAIRSAVRLREILADEATADDRWGKSEAAHALGDLR
jgi:hypothetical protein